MAKDLTITGFEDKPGVIAGLGEAFGSAGVNIQGGFGAGRLGEIHVLVEDGEVDSARSAVESAGLTAGETRDALVVSAEDRPGALGEVARKIADSGVNLEYVYIASNTRLVFVGGDVEKARAALG